MLASKRRYVSKMLKLRKHELGKSCLRAKEKTLYQFDNKDNMYGYFLLYYCLFKHALPHCLIHLLPLKLCSLAKLDSLQGCIFFHLVFFIISLLKSPVNFPRPGVLSCLALFPTANRTDYRRPSGDYLLISSNISFFACY